MPDTHTPEKLGKNDNIHDNLMTPVYTILPDITPALWECNRPLKMSFEDQLSILVYFHLEEHRSGSHLLRALEKEHFPRQHIAPVGNIEKSSFVEDISSHGLQQMTEMLSKLYTKAVKHLPQEYAQLGDLVLISGSSIDGILSAYWADYPKDSKKPNVLLCFDLNRGIPNRIFLTDGIETERFFIETILAPGETGVMDREYQNHKLFDSWQAEGKYYICRIKASTKKTATRMSVIHPDSTVFYDAVVLLGIHSVDLTVKEVRLIGYREANVNYWIATNRHDLTAEQITFAYKLKWSIEIFSGWWKHHLKIYHLVSRSQYGLMVQMLSGLITYILLTICSYDQHRKHGFRQMSEGDDLQFL